MAQFGLVNHVVQVLCVVITSAEDLLVNGGAQGSSRCWISRRFPLCSASLSSDGTLTGGQCRKTSRACLWRAPGANCFTFRSCAVFTSCKAAERNGGWLCTL